MTAIERKIFFVKELRRALTRPPKSFVLDLSSDTGDLLTLWAHVSGSYRPNDLVDEYGLTPDQLRSLVTPRSNLTRHDVLEILDAWAHTLNYNAHALPHWYMCDGDDLEEYSDVD
jgi:hypothetical protein